MPAKKRARTSARPPRPDIDERRGARSAQDADAGVASGIFPAWIRWAVYLAVPAALAVLTSLNTLSNGFASDDEQQVLNNTFIKALGNLPLAFTTSVWSYVQVDILMTAQPYYRPLFSVLFTINYALFGTAAWGWHLANVVIHALVTVLMYVTLEELTGRRILAASAAALFAVHPAHAESVAWISGVTDPLMGLFLLPSLFLFFRYRRDGKKWLLFWSLFLYLMALLSKETAAALPLFVAYSELFHFRGPGTFTRRIRRAAILVGIYAIPTAVYLLMRFNALATLLSGDEFRYPAGPAMATIPLAFIKYLGLMVVPHGYSYQHLTPFVRDPLSIRFILPLLVIIMIVLGLLWARSRLLNMAGMLFLAPLAPALIAIRHFDPEYVVQERYLYLPSVGFCLAIALGIERLAKVAHGRSWRVITSGTLAVIIAVWGLVLMKQNRVWESSLSLFQNCVAVAPDSAPARNALAGSYYANARAPEALTEAEIALELDPAFPNTYLNLSYFAHSTGNLDVAIEHLERGIAAVGDDPVKRNGVATLLLNLGLLYGQRKEYERSERTLIASINTWSRVVGYYYTGRFYMEQGRFEEARRMFEEVRIRVPAGFAPIHLMLGMVYDALNQPQQAIPYYLKYLEQTMENAPDRARVNTRLRQLGIKPVTGSR